ncbi:MAG: transcription termination/antitermination protein NusA, partial [Candidatus Moranbacteria bacterium]|nr:transcription termination/antitermination protein NusA [Candidatus Moranbacteria bacterium]
LLEDALKIKKNISIGDVLEEELESHTTFGRVAAQTAKQVIIQKIREAERESMFADFKKREGEVVSGTVERIEGRAIYVTVGRSTGVIFANEQSPNDRYRVGQRIKVYVIRVDSDPRGPGIILSRADKELVRNLFALEVPEIFAKTVEIKAIAREAGVRTKMAVFAREEGIDPIGSCVGQKGTRVQAVIDELGGEKIDIIEWSENPEKFIRSAMSPAKIIRIDLDKERQFSRIIVPEDQLSLAIGRQGQNVRLASKLTEWQIDIVSEEEDKEENKEEIIVSEKGVVEEEKVGEEKAQESQKQEEKEGNVVEEEKVEKKVKKASSPKKKKE